MDLGYWLISHGVSRNEIDKKPPMFLFDCMGRKFLVHMKGYIGMW